MGESGFTQSRAPRLYWYRNIGLARGARGGIPQFEWVTSNADSAFGFDSEQDGVAGYLVPLLIDLSGDGLVDLLLGSEDGRLREYRNVGTAGTPRFERTAGHFEEVDVGGLSAPALGDIDADGDRDLFVGEENGGVNFFRDVAEGAPLLVAFSAVPVDTAIEVSWEMETDAAVRFDLLRAEEGGDFAPVAAPAAIGGGPHVVRDADGLSPGNAYRYRLEATFPWGLGSCFGPTEVFLPIPVTQILAPRATLLTGVGGTLLEWQVSRTFPGLAFRVSAREGCGAFATLAGGESLPGETAAAFTAGEPASATATFRIEALYREGDSLAPVPDSIIPAADLTTGGATPFQACPARPNPSRAGRAVEFLLDLPEDAAVRVVLFDASGRRVRRLGPVPLAAGASRMVSWDGKDDDGEDLPAGLYLYRIEAGERSATGRVVRLR